MKILESIFVEWPGARVCEGIVPFKPDLGCYDFGFAVVPTKEEVDAWKDQIKLDQQKYWCFYTEYALQVRGWKIKKRGNHVSRKKIAQLEKV